MKNHTNVGYVALRLSERDAYRITTLLDSMGIKDTIPNDEMHMTLMYDESNPMLSDRADNLVDPKLMYPVDVIGVDVLGDPDSEYRAVVLKTRSKSVDSRHQMWSAFMTHSKPDFIQHISVKYKPTEIDIDTLKAYEDLIVDHIGMVVLHQEYAEEIRGV